MKIIVQPQKGDSYKLLFYDGRNVRGAGYVDLQDTPRGPRPTKYRVKWGSKKEYRHTPSKDLVASLRESDVLQVKRDHRFETFLSDFQLKSGVVNACRMCLLDDTNTIQFGKSEHICLD